jgi:ubiquinone/menaquinone biosynthesis C-methylase UbiE
MAKIAMTGYFRIDVAPRFHEIAVLRWIGMEGRLNEMAATDIVRHPFTDDVNLSELHYRDQVQPHEEAFAAPSQWIQRVEDGRRALVPAVGRHVSLHGRVLELGAGCCWFSAELSKLDSVSSVVSLEMSEHLLEQVAPHVLAHLGARTDKITRVVGDFHQLHFPDGSFDFVVFDAAMHHVPTANLPRVLGEVRRVLTPDGMLVAIREPFLTSLPVLRAIRRRQFGRHERKYGVTENAYTAAEWRRVLDTGDFTIRLIPQATRADRTASSSRLARLAVRHTPLNAILRTVYPRYFIVMERAALRPSPAGPAQATV